VPIAQIYAKRPRTLLGWRVYYESVLPKHGKKQASARESREFGWGGWARNIEGASAMQDRELEQAQSAIPPLLARTASECGESLSVPQLVEALGPAGIGEEAVRLAAWSLVDRGAIEMTSDWRLQPRREKASA
jgi:hypothetical protein